VEPEKKEVEVGMELEKAVFFEKEAVLKEDLDVEFDCLRWFRSYQLSKLKKEIIIEKDMSQLK